MNAAYHDLYQIIGLNIAYYRNLRGLSQEQLGDKLNIDQSHLSKIERAAVGVSMDRLCDIAKELDVAPYQLLKPLETTAPAIGRCGCFLEKRGVLSRDGKYQRSSKGEGFRFSLPLGYPPPFKNDQSGGLRPPYWMYPPGERSPLVGRGLAPAVQDHSSFCGGPKGPPYPKNYPKILI